MMLVTWSTQVADGATRRQQQQQQQQCFCHNMAHNLVKLMMQWALRATSGEALVHGRPIHFYTRCPDVHCSLLLTRVGSWE